MSARPASNANQVRRLRILGLGFITALAVTFVVLLVLSRNWDPADDGLAGLGTVIAGAIGIAGVAASVWWRNRALAAPMEPDRLVTSWLAAAAVAEAGMVVGFVFALLGRSLTPFLVGGVIFAVALLILTTAVGQVEA